ncbi:MAG: energy transducer TonB [Pseudomonadota bacterium]
MYFAQNGHENGNKATKFAVVALVHVVLGYALISSINTIRISMPTITDVFDVTFDKTPPPEPTPEPPTKTAQIAPPDVYVPPVDVQVQTPPPQDAIAAKTIESPPAPSEATAAVGTPTTAPPSTGTLRTAVLADACATPRYPTRAARNGEQGTTLLALLVGTDGHVNGSRVQKTSGSRDLDKAAVEALSLCKFKPATEGGAPAQGWAQIAYVWKLEE